MYRFITIIIYCVLFYGSCFSQEDPDKERCRQMMRQGEGYLFRFRPEKSLLKYDTAISIAKKMNDSYLLSIGFLGAGQAQWYMGRMAGAIDTMNRSVALMRKAKEHGESRWILVSGLRILGNIYDATGEYDKEFAVVTEAISRCRKGDDKQNLILSLVQMGNMYRNIGDFAAARKYYVDAEKLNPQKGNYDYRELNQQIGRLQAAQGNYDSAQYYYQKSLPGHPIPRNVYVRMGECYILQQKWKDAEKYLNGVYQETDINEDPPVLIPTMIGLGKIRLHSHQLDSALFYARGALHLAEAKDARHSVRDARLLLYEIHDQLHHSDSALYYYKNYVRLRDEVISEQFKGQLYAFKKRSETAEQESQLQLLKWSIAAFVVIALIIIFLLVYRYRHEKLKLQQKSAELEMKALRAQMNPHFIFNCLSAINHFVLKGDTDKAADYLTKFSRLIRLVLINSEKNTITLEEELGMLKLYLEMEQLRFKDSFDYEIRYDPPIHPSMTYMPSFILQPFCENAIWHGLLHKGSKGKLVIDFTTQGNFLVCTITDNGIGRKKAAEIKTKITDAQHSFGNKLTSERLAIFNGPSSMQNSFVISDITDNHEKVIGTRVVIKIKQVAI